MQSIIQILKVNEPKSGVKEGRPWEMQDAECALLDDDGSLHQVGVLSIPKALRGKVDRGIYTGTFALAADMRTRKIGAVLTNLTPVPQRKDPAQKPA